MKDSSISDAFQEMWRDDFVEQDPEKKAYSREDRWFLNKMTESIEYDQGHYVLPLPLRMQSTEAGKVEDEKEMCGQEKM